MDLSGKIISQLPEVSGSSKSGNAWRKQEFIVETGGQYPKKVCVSLWGDKIDQFGLKVGEQVNLSIEIESREYNGRWYTDIRAWNVTKQGAAPSVGGNNSLPNFEGAPVADSSASNNAASPFEDDDLPF